MATNGRSWTALLPILTAVVYGASPVDVIPDILLLVGWIDDGMMGFVMAVMSLWLFVRNRRAQRVAGTVPPLPHKQV